MNAYVSPSLGARSYILAWDEAGEKGAIEACLARAPARSDWTKRGGAYGPTGELPGRLARIEADCVEARSFGALNETVELIETIEKLRVRNIGFRSLTEALDTTTAQGRLVFHMFGALAEFERSLIRERTQAGLAAARRIGRTGGHPPKLTDEDIEAAKAMLANPDIGVTQIAHRLGVSPATLYRYIPAARTANTQGV
jgi:DNA invertase Pin-like site-specific DNA recombinase